MRAAAILLVAMLAGCASAPSTGPQNATVHASASAPCEPLELTTDRASFVAGESVLVTLTFTNCGAEPRSVLDGDCGSNTLVVLGMSPRWAFVSGDDVPTMRANADCRALATLAPGASHVETWHWRGDARYRLANGTEAAAPVPGGTVTLLASWDAPQILNRDVAVRWDPKPCAKLDASATPAAFAAGNVSRLEVALTNCGAAGIPVAPSTGCGGDLQATLTRGNATWLLDPQFAAPHRYVGMPFSHGYCIGGFGTERVIVAPGATERVGLAWNGTTILQDMCSTGPNQYTGCERDEPAEPGDYTLAASFGALGLQVNATPVTVRWEG